MERIEYSLTFSEMSSLVPLGKNHPYLMAMSLYNDSNKERRVWMENNTILYAIVKSLFSVQMNAVNPELLVSDEWWIPGDTVEESTLVFPKCFYQRVTCVKNAVPHPITISRPFPSQIRKTWLDKISTCTYVSDYDAILASLPERNHHENTLKNYTIPVEECKSKDSWLWMHVTNIASLEASLIYVDDDYNDWNPTLANTMYGWSMAYHLGTPTQDFEEYASTGIIHEWYRSKSTLPDDMFDWRMQNRPTEINVLQRIPRTSTPEFYLYARQHIKDQNLRKECIAAMFIIAVYREMLTESLIQDWWHELDYENKKVFMLFVHTHGLTKSQFKLLYPYMTVTEDLDCEPCMLVDFSVLTYVRYNPEAGFNELWEPGDFILGGPHDYHSICGESSLYTIESSSMFLHRLACGEAPLLSESPLQVNNLDKDGVEKLASDLGTL